MRIAALCCLGQFIDDMLWRWPVRISHTKIDDILTTRSSGSLQLIDNVEDIGRQAFDSGEFVHERFLSALVEVWPA